MKKSRFLDTIQNLARTSERAAKAWSVAIKVDETDNRWAKVASHPHEDIVLQNFETVFGLADTTVEDSEDEKRRKYHERQLEKAEAKLVEMKERKADPDRIKLQENKIENLKFMLG